MATQTFTWNPDEGASEDTKPDVASTKFGDGYEQRVAKGINSKVISWTVTFTGNMAKVSPIRNFLNARNGVESFIWVNPLSESALYVCRSWKLSKLSAGIGQVSAKFDRVYEAIV